MAIPQYVLLASLAAGMQAHGDAANNTLLLSPEVITQPNGGVVVVAWEQKKGTKVGAAAPPRNSGSSGHSPGSSGSHSPTITVPRK